jgi:carbon monoxide dehydrogenase subunit G
MPKFEIEVDGEKGEFLGQLPAEIDAILKRIEITAHGTGFRSGQGKAAEDAKKQIEDTVKAERAKWEAQAPLEREKYQLADEENKTLKTQLTEVMRESDRNLRKREESHAEELTKRVADIAKRDARIRELVGMNIRALAMQVGAREDALPALEAVLQNRLAFDDEMQPFFKDESGQQASLHGKPMSADAFVKQFLNANTYFLKPTGGQGGGARGGASFQHGAQHVPSAQAARERVELGDRSAGAVNELFEATRKKRAS